MIHVYDKNATLEDLRKVELVPPKGAGSHWQGIQHGELVDTIIDECRLKGWQPGDMAFSLARKGADMVGAVELRMPGLEPPEGMGFNVGIVTSNARRKSLQLMVGATVTICHNGLATGQVVVKRKHTGAFDLSEEIDRGLDDYAKQAAGMAQQVERLRSLTISNAKAAEIIGQAGQEEIMARGRLWDVAREFMAPSHDHGLGTGWTLLNAFTLVAKQSPPSQQMQSMNRFRQLVLAA